MIYDHILEELRQFREEYVPSQFNSDRIAIFDRLEKNPKMQWPSNAII